MQDRWDTQSPKKRIATLECLFIYSVEKEMKLEMFHWRKPHGLSQAYMKWKMGLHLPFGLGTTRSVLVPAAAITVSIDRCLSASLYRGQDLVVTELNFSQKLCLLSWGITEGKKYLNLNSGLKCCGLVPRKYFWDTQRMGENKKPPSGTQKHVGESRWSSKRAKGSKF